MKSEHSHFDSIPDTRLLMRSEVNTSFIPCEREREGERWESAGKGRGRERERERDIIQLTSGTAQFWEARKRSENGTPPTPVERG